MFDMIFQPTLLSFSSYSMIWDPYTKGAQAIKGATENVQIIVTFPPRSTPLAMLIHIMYTL